MKQIELDVFYNTEESRKLESMGIDTENEDYIIKKHTFYNIDHISPADNPKHSRVYSCADHVIIPISYEKLKLLIDKAFS